MHSPIWWRSPHRHISPIPISVAFVFSPHTTRLIKQLRHYVSRWDTVSFTTSYVIASSLYCDLSFFKNCHRSIVCYTLESIVTTCMTKSYVCFPYIYGLELWNSFRKAKTLTVTIFWVPLNGPIITFSIFFWEVGTFTG